MNVERKFLIYIVIYYILVLFTLLSQDQMAYGYSDFYSVEKYLKTMQIITIDDHFKQSAHEVVSRSASFFSRQDMRIKTTVSAKIIDNGFKGTPLYGLGKYFVDAANKNGIDPLRLAGLSANESEWGKSKMARTKNNIFGYCAYDSNTNMAIRFKSKKECIYVVAKAISNNYLSKDGDYYNGYSLKSMNVRYASDKLWHLKVAKCAKMILIKGIEK